MNYESSDFDVIASGFLDAGMEDERAAACAERVLMTLAQCQKVIVDRAALGHSESLIVRLKLVGMIRAKRFRDRSRYEAAGVVEELVSDIVRMLQASPQASNEEERNDPMRHLTPVKSQFDT